MAIERLSSADYPGIDPVDVGAHPNVGYGALKSVRTHCVVGGAVALLAADITADATTFSVDSVDQFPATPFTIQIQDERLRVINIAALILTVTRGYDSTEPAAHKLNKTVYEVLTSYIYLVANHPMKTIDNVYIDGSLQVSRFTAYTGQAGDEHGSYSGKAVIEFDVEAYVAPQFNLDNSAEKEQGTRVEIKPEFGSSKIWAGDVVPQFFGLEKKIGSGEVVWVQFPIGYGQIIRQRYSVNVTPSDSVIDELLKYSVCVTENEILKAYTDKHDSRFSLTRAGGIWNDVLKISNQGKDIDIGQILKFVTKKNERYGVGADTNIASIDPPTIIESYGADGQPALVGYSATSPVTDATIVTQDHFAEITLPELDPAARARICAVNPTTNKVIAFRDYEFPELADTGGELTLSHPGGSWDTITKVVYSHDIETDHYSIGKTVNYTTPEIIGAAVTDTTSSARAVVGVDITVDGSFAVDTTGDYGGASTLIERPDWVIKHFIVTQMGAALADIDSTSFAAAGALYASAISGGYKFNFLWDVRFNEDEMAFEARSVIYMTRGKYYLDFIPDTAPAAAVTVPEGDTIGRGFLFDHGKIEELYTNYTARFGKINNRQWSGVVTAADGSSKHGVRYQQVDLPLMTSELMAQDVLDLILLQNKKLYKTIKLDTSWKYHTLQIGDTFDITSTLHNGMKFFVEKLKINSNNTIKIEAKEWW